MISRILFTIFVLFLGNAVWAQQSSDTLKVLRLIQEASESLDKGGGTKAIRTLNEAIDYSIANEMPKQSALALQILGKAYYNQKNNNQALEAYIHAATLFDRTQNTESFILVNATIGHIYYKMGAYQKAVEYYDVVVKKGEQNSKLHKRASYNLAEALMRAGKKEEATLVYEGLLETETRANNSRKITSVTLKLTQLYSDSDELDKAETLCESSLLKVGASDIISSFRIKNALIFIHNRKKNFLKAKEVVLTIGNEDKLVPPSPEVNLFDINAGVTFSNLKEHVRAKAYFENAESYYTQMNDKEGLASVQNYKAADLYLLGDVTKALELIDKGIVMAKSANALEELQTAYLLQEKILTENNASQRAKVASDNLKRIQPQLDSFEAEQQVKDEEVQNKSVLNEVVIRERIAEREQKERAMRQVKIEAERKESELKLLKQSEKIKDIKIQNQNLEKDKINQMYALLQSKAKTDELEKNKEIHALQLKQIEADKEKRTQQIKLLEQQKALGELKLEEENKQKRMAFGVIGLVVIVLLIMILAFLTLRKRNARIKEQNVMINEQKEEMMQQTEELIQQSENVKEANEKITFQHAQISASIRYARTIQATVLPDLKAIDGAYDSSFVLFRPKDVVSGDFYWFHQPKEKNVSYISAVDCTGHGVPGAFMSLIGSRIMNELVIRQYVTSPSEVLQELDNNIRASLNQDESGNRDGMDMCFCKVEYLDNGDAKIVYAGAKRPIIYHNKETGAIEQIKGSRRSIGGAAYNGKSLFEDTELILKKGSTVYLSSDGYIDQNGGVIDQKGGPRKKIGTPKFLKLLDSIKEKSLEDQCEALGAFLENHMGGVEQRDDITVVAFMI